MQMLDSFCELFFLKLSASWVVWHAGSFTAGCKLLVFRNQLYLLGSLLKLQSLSDGAGIAASCCCSGCMIGSWPKHLHSKWCSQMAVFCNRRHHGTGQDRLPADDKGWC